MTTTMKPTSAGKCATLRRNIAAELRSIENSRELQSIFDAVASVNEDADPVESEECAALRRGEDHSIEEPERADALAGATQSP